MSVWKFWLYLMLWGLGIAFMTYHGALVLNFVGGVLLGFGIIWTYLRLYKVK